MARPGRPASGSLEVRQLADGTRAYIARFRAYGRRHTETVGHSDGITREEAERRLADIISDVRRGKWRPGQEEAPGDPRGPLLGDACRDFLASREQIGTSEKQIEWLRRMIGHLHPIATVHVGDLALEHSRLVLSTAVDERKALDDARAALQRGANLDSLPAAQRDAIARYGRSAKGLDQNSRYRLMSVLRRIIEFARNEYPDVNLARNPADAKTLGLERTTPHRPAAEIPQIAALLDAAAQLESEASSGRKANRPLLILLLFFAGLRISEVGNLRRRDVDLKQGRLLIAMEQGGKTVASRREVNIVPKLQPALRDRIAQMPKDADALVLPTTRGEQRNSNNTRRLFAAIVTRAQTLLAERDEAPLPARCTTHAGRRSFVTALALNGESADYIMSQCGHDDIETTWRVYRQAASRRGKRDPRLREWYGAPEG